MKSVKGLVYYIEIDFQITKNHFCCLL